MELRTDRFKFKELFPEKAKKYAQKLHIKADEIEFVRKGIPIDPKDIEIKEGERAAIRYVTTPHLDRDSEILIPTGAMLDDFRQSPSVLYAHDYKGLPIGKDLWIKPTAKGILAKTQYAKHQFAEDVYQCVKGKFLNSNSVGFIPVESVKPDDKKAFAELQDMLEKDFEIPKKESGKAKNIYTKWIMLEHSDVPVASNAQSLNLAVSKGDLPIQSERLKKDLEIEVVKDLKEVEIEFEKAVLKGEAEKINKEFMKEIVVEKDVTVKSEIKLKDVKRAWETLGDPGHIIIKPEIDIEEAEGEIKALIDKKTKATIEQKLEAFVRKHDLQFMKSEYSLLDVINKFAGTYHLDIDYDKEGKVVITKPETTENYHHIPINPGCKITATITISASQGIRATYCGAVKKIHTYLFDVNKWTMEEAKKWVSEHKPKYHERWNKSFSKLFDIASAESSKPLRFHYDMYEKFLECKVKEIFQNGYVIPSPLLGTYLAGLKEILGEFDLKDTRKFSWDGSEVPPDYEVIQLNSEKSDDFLISGMCFYEAEKKPLVVNFSPDYFGLTLTLITSNENKEWNKELLDKVHSWVYENNFLKGEKFSLSGEFLHEPDDDWDNLILDDKYKDSIRKSANFLEKRGKAFTGRGLLFIGPPGTGKTKTGRVLMNELDATFIWVSSKDFRHIGPLRALALGFSLARSLAPAVLFLEDIDTWLRGEMEFVTDMIKTEMDGIKQNRGIITILTSNYPEKLPDALLDRPGRFHHIVNFELPKAEHREKMLKMWAGDIDEELLKEITEKTEGFSGAHIKELVEFAKMIAEEDDVEIGKALIMSLDKLMEQRELIEEIRDNKTDAKEFWGKLKYAPISGIFLDVEKKEALRADVSDELEEGKGIAIGVQRHIKPERMDYVEIGPRIGKPIEEKFDFSKLRVDINLADVKEWQEVISNMQEELKAIKEGRVLSRKNRKIVKDAITALNAVLKADATGSREDEESETGTVTERGIEIEKEGEKEFSKEDIAKVVKEVSGEQMGEILKDAFEKALNPEKMKAMVSEGIKLELDKLRGKVT